MRQPKAPFGATPDNPARTSRQRHSLPPSPVLAVISAGGALGALARYGLQQAFPHAQGRFGWSTFAVNVSGCLLIGVLMVLVGEVGAAWPLLRPFLGVGVLGGYTTFSTYVVDIRQSIEAGTVATALAYLVATLLGALIAVWAGAALTTAALRHTGAGPRAGAKPPGPSGKAARTSTRAARTSTRGTRTSRRAPGRP